MIKNLEKPSQILSLTDGSMITKRNLFEVIQYSKIKSSVFWEGQDYIIGNTPQQGINWIGSFPYLKGVIIKEINGAYNDDGWENAEKKSFRYSYKVRKGIINFSEIANDVLIKQPKYLYPILLFIEVKNSWEYQGAFNIKEIGESFVSLEKVREYASQVEISQDESVFQEGGRKYAIHLVIERSQSAINSVKSASKWICDICGQNYFDKYGIAYIEAHHKIPLSKFTGKRDIKLSDFALLCPNCHKAIHIYMKREEQDYETIKLILKNLF